MSGGNAARVLELLVARGESVAVAESLTGGLLAAALTDVPGASRVFRGSVTAYATDVKRDVLGVDAALLTERGAVDSDVARAMADGVRRLLAADWGVSTTGVAGPDPQDGREPGTVHVAVAGPRGAAAHAVLGLPGDRQAVRAGTVREALGLLWEELLKNASGHDTEQSGGS